MTHLLDTNAWIQALNQPYGSVGTRVTKMNSTDLGLCSITTAELYTGAEKSHFPQENADKIDELVMQFGCIDYGLEDSRIYARIRAFLERIGQPIGFHDTQIAAIALNHNLIVVTHNVREFSRVPGLVIEDWQVP